LSRVSRSSATDSWTSSREPAPGLRRWTAWHEHWEEEVASLALDTSDGLVLVDPIDPPKELRNPQHVLITVYWHGRTAAGIGAQHVWASTRSARPLQSRGIAVSDTFRAGDELPGGIAAFQTARSAEVAYWLPGQGALAVGAAPFRRQRTARAGLSPVHRQIRRNRRG
jgi:hypothetical protein